MKASTLHNFFSKYQCSVSSCVSLVAIINNNANNNNNKPRIVKLCGKIKSCGISVVQQFHSSLKLSIVLIIVITH